MPREFYWIIKRKKGSSRKDHGNGEKKQDSIKGSPAEGVSGPEVMSFG
jgi:hypothetical protein